MKQPSWLLVIDLSEDEFKLYCLSEPYICDGKTPVNEAAKVYPRRSAALNEKHEDLPIVSFTRWHCSPSHETKQGDSIKNRYKSCKLQQLARPYESH